MNLLHNRFFTNFTEAGARALAEYAEEISYNDQTVLFDEGDPSDSFYILLEGRVELSKRGEGDRQVVIEIVQAGEYFGEMGILDDSPRSARATSRGPSRLARIPASPFLRILHQEPARASLHFFNELLGHLRKSNERVVRGTVHEEEIRLVGETVNTIVNDLRSRVSNIKPSIEQIRKRHSEAPTQEDCHQILEQLTLAVTTVQDLFDFCCGRPTLKKQRMKVAALFNEFKKENKLLLDQPGIEIAAPPDTELNVDMDRMNYVLRNLVEYASDMLETTEGKVTVYAKEAGDSVEICVQDNGPGIPESIQESFFEPLVIRSDRKGAGLSMAMVRKIVEAHSGEIWFTTEANKGTLFFIRLPRVKG
jgi:signal transduction histidine kinase